MRAVVRTAFGPPDVLQLKEVDKPSPVGKEVLIRVHATSVSTGDVNARGFTFVPPGLGPLARLMMGRGGPKTPILGSDLAGRIEAVGNEVERFKEGDQVFGINAVVQGAYADYVCWPEDWALVEKPARLTYEEAAAIPFGATVAAYFLRDMGRVRSGQKVLVNGASGSAGSAAVQIAKALGAEVTGVCSTTNVDLVKSLGADRVIDYTREDFTQDGEIYDAIFDSVFGKTSFSHARRALKDDGLYLAVAGGLREMIQAQWTAVRGGRRVIFGGGEAVETTDIMLFVKELIEAGKFKAVIDRVFPLEQIVEAHRYVETGHKKGNVVITVARQDRS